MVLEMADINHGIWEIGCLLVCRTESQSKIERCCARLCLLASCFAVCKPRQRLQDHWKLGILVGREVGPLGVFEADWNSALMLGKLV